MDFSRYDKIPFGPFLEEWKDIKGYEGSYRISNYGRVFSMYKDSKRNMILKALPTKEGYLTFDITKDGKTKRVKIHRIVAEHFIENYENKPIINHIRGFKNDNLFTQLEWCTRAENNYHSYHYLGNTNVRDESKKKEIKIKATHIISGDIMFFNNLLDTERKGFVRQIVRECLLGKREYYKYYKWELNTDDKKNQIKMNNTKIITASVRVALSHQYNSFEVALTIENQDGLTLEEIETFRMQAQEQAGAAVEDYKVTMQPQVEKPFVKTGFKPNKQVINVSEQDEEPPLKDNAKVEEIVNLPPYTPKNKK